MSGQTKPTGAANKTSRQSLTPARENTNEKTTNVETRRATRATTTASAPSLDELKGMPFEELIKLGSSNKVTDLNTARELLHRYGYFARDAPVTPLILATLLMTFMVYNDKKMLANEAATILRSIAIMMANEDTENIAGLVATRVSDMAEEVLEEVRKATKKLDEATSAMLHTAEEADNATEKLARQAEQIIGDQGRMADIADSAEMTLSAIQESTGRLDAQLENIAKQPPPPPLSSHLSQEAWPKLPSQMLPTPPPDIAVRHTEAARTVVFDLNSAAADDAKEMSEEEMVKRANIAVDKMGPAAGTKPKETLFAAATKLERGGVRYRMQDAACAEWIKQPLTKELFLKEFFGGAGALTNKQYTVIVEFVPVKFDTENPEEWREIERQNGLEEGTVSGGKWLKKAENRKIGQRSAHMEVICTTQRAGTQLIRGGTVIGGKIHATRKKLREPERCMKCQGFGHKALRCKAKNDICAICADTHRTSSCQASTKKCTNCAGDSSMTRHNHHYEGPSRTKITRQLTGSCDRGRMPPNGAILGRSAENRPEPGQPWWIGCNQGLYKSFMVNMWPVLRGSRRFYSDLVVAGTRSDSNWI
jgi:hypothetical protein